MKLSHLLTAATLVLLTAAPAFAQSTPAHLPDSIAARRAAGQAIVEKLRTPENARESAKRSAETDTSKIIGNELSRMAVENIFGGIWTRPGLSLRDRELVTLGLLIAQRANSELVPHFEIARNVGITREELSEIIYQSAAYAGMPAAHNARDIANKVLPPGK